MRLEVKVSENEYNGMAMQHRLEQYHETLRARLDIIFTAVVIVCSDISYNYDYVRAFIYNADINKIIDVLCSGKTGDDLFQYITNEASAFKHFGV